jgi:hypothetical protein
VTLPDLERDTGFALEVPDPLPQTRAPTNDELRLIREVLDPAGARKKELQA